MRDIVSKTRKCYVDLETVLLHSPTKEKKIACGLCLRNENKQNNQKKTKFDENRR